jgi:hypothetical protein
MLTSLLFDRKMEKKGRYDMEMEELDAFSNTGYPKHHVTISSNG